jgi:hypothetical protein
MSRTTVWPVGDHVAVAPPPLVLPRQVLDLCMGLVPRHMRQREAPAEAAMAEPAPEAPIEAPIMENAEEWVDRMTRDLRQRIMSAV